MKTKNILLSLVLLFTLSCKQIVLDELKSQEQVQKVFSPNFISIYRIGDPSFGDGDNTLTLPLRPGLTYNFQVDWGDGTTLESVTTDVGPTHIYAAPGDYTVTITGVVQGWRFNNSGDKDKLIRVESLGNMEWVNLWGAFYGCQNLEYLGGGNTSGVTTMRDMLRDTPNLIVDTSTWNTANVTSMSGMFQAAHLANPDTSGWDVSNVINFYYMFYDAQTANPDTSNWNTSSATSMFGMFRGAISAYPQTRNWDVSGVSNFSFTFESIPGNPDVSLWDTSSATAMNAMFRNATNANPDVRNFDVSGVDNFSNMFSEALSANPDTSLWVTTNATDFSFMFYQASIANPDVSGWVTNKVTNMRSMFQEALSANPDMSSWNLGNVTNMSSMFYLNTSLSNVNYSNFLIAIDNTSVQSGVSLDGGVAEYSSGAAAARANLVSNGWTIIDGGAE